MRVALISCSKATAPCDVPSGSESPGSRRDVAGRHAVPVRRTIVAGQLDLAALLREGRVPARLGQQLDKLLAVDQRLHGTFVCILGVDRQQAFGAGIGQHQLVVFVDHEHRCEGPRVRSVRGAFATRAARTAFRIRRVGGRARRSAEPFSPAVFGGVRWRGSRRRPRGRRPRPARRPTARCLPVPARRGTTERCGAGVARGPRAGPAPLQPSRGLRSIATSVHLTSRCPAIRTRPNRRRSPTPRPVRRTSTAAIILGKPWCASLDRMTRAARPRRTASHAHNPWKNVR